jgi:hypothetical protein
MSRSKEEKRILRIDFFKGLLHGTFMTDKGMKQSLYTSSPTALLLYRAIGYRPEAWRRTIIVSQSTRLSELPYMAR